MRQGWGTKMLRYTREGPGSLNLNGVSFPREILDRPRLFPEGNELCREQGDAYLLLEGWVYSYRLTMDGSRQIIDFKLPGDAVGIRNLFRPVGDLCYGCLTDVLAAPLRVGALKAALSRSPEIVQVVASEILASHHTREERVANLGRFALERVSYLLLELGQRLYQIGLARLDGYPCPLTHSIIADALGITQTHCCRTLSALREQGLATLSGRDVQFHDVERLVEISGFTGPYVDAAIAARAMFPPPCRNVPAGHRGGLAIAVP